MDHADPITFTDADINALYRAGAMIVSHDQTPAIEPDVLTHIIGGSLVPVAINLWKNPTLHTYTCPICKASTQTISASAQVFHHCPLRDRELRKMQLNKET